MISDVVPLWVCGEENNSSEKLFDSSRYYDTQKLLKDGQLEDTFKNNSNFQISSIEFDGRQVEMHSLSKLLNNHSFKIINIYGHANIGKTSFVQELFYYLNI